VPAPRKNVLREPVAVRAEPLKILCLETPYPPSRHTIAEIWNPQKMTVLHDRSSAWVFIAGCVAVTLGVILHLPMFWMARGMGFSLTGMVMDPAMFFGMALIVAGLALAAYGLLPKNIAAQIEASRHISVAAPEDAPLTLAHWGLMVVLVVALIIDVMKPASLGFVMPGMTREYGVATSTAALVPFFALTGTVVGSVIWGIIADIYGRKASILLSAIMFVGTSICGTMPSLAWNIGMCLMMGAAAGGMLPVTYALLAETMPSPHRGWSLVLVGGLGAAGGYFAASGFSAWLEPVFSWRILWLLNLPTGLALLLMGRFIPESAKFLLARGRRAEAQRVMTRFGSISHDVAPDEEEVDFTLHPGAPHPQGSLLGLDYVGKTAALSIVAIAWGLINFGLLLWLPADLVAKGYSMAVTSSLLAKSALIAFPTVLLVALLYSRWSTKWALVTMICLTLAGLVGVLILETNAGSSPIIPVALLIIGSNGILAILLPYAAESYPLNVRGRATGWVAACSKFGGLLAQGLSISALVPPLAIASVIVMIPMLASLVLIWWFGNETRGLDLRSLETAQRLA
jgi:MFS transporter, putative metabolite:H+ symporter